MAQDEFIALIEGRADLKDARDAFTFTRGGKWSMIKQMLFYFMD